MSFSQILALAEFLVKICRALLIHGKPADSQHIKAVVKRLVPRPVVGYRERLADVRLAPELGEILSLEYVPIAVQHGPLAVLGQILKRVHIIRAVVHQRLVVINIRLNKDVVFRLLGLFVFAVDEQPLNEVYLGIDGAVAAELVPENSCKVKVFAVVVRRIRVSDVFCDYLLLLPEDGQPLLRYPECIRIEKCHIFSSLSRANSTKWHTIPYSYSYYNYTPFHNILQQFFHDIFLHNVESVY